jgi:hypothetical protein
MKIILCPSDSLWVQLFYLTFFIASAPENASSIIKLYDFKSPLRAYILKGSSSTIKISGQSQRN